MQQIRWDSSCSWVELDPEVTPRLGHERREGKEDLVHLSSILRLVVFATFVIAAPKACAKGQVLEALLEGILDATSVDLQCAGVEFDTLEAKIILSLPLRDDAVVSKEEYGPIALTSVDEIAICIPLTFTTLR